MSLRTRIALTFLGLLTAVLVAALSVVSVANRVNQQRAVAEKLESNRQLLAQAVSAIVGDFGFREAVADHDTDTLASVLDNVVGRAYYASLVVLTSLDGHVLAATGLHAPAGSVFPADVLRQTAPAGEGIPNILVDNGKLYQLVEAQVLTPLPVAYVAMGFELDEDAASGLRRIDGQVVSLVVHSGNSWRTAITRNARAMLLDMHEGIGSAPAGRENTTTVQSSREKLSLARSFAEARAPFEELTKKLVMIAGVGVVGFAWAAFWIARNVTRPLKTLTLAVDKIRGGAYNLNLGLRRDDELGVLAEGLQLMQTAVMSRDQSIRRLAYEDALTGLMNRTAFNANLGQALVQAGGAAVGVAIINLHRFRRINEHLGYSVGDAVLTTIASRLAAVPSVQSAVARLAADEFAAFAQLRDAGELQAWGASLLVALSEDVVVEAQPIDITATVGLAVCDDAAGAADDLLRRADLAMERARREKRSLAIYEETSNDGARDQLSLLGELRRAIEHDELRLFFQPKIELSTGRVAGAEVLLRWQHPTRGLLAPAAFIPFAEQTGFIRRITRWTLDRAMAAAAAWYRAGHSLPVAINISADDLGDVRLDTRVAGLLSRHQLPPPLLTLEVTESGFIEDPNSALKLLDALAALGVNVSIDDFGTGYSSLSHLARMPADELKIDRSFVQGLESDAEYAAIVRSAIEMGHSLGMKVVAEGIETEVAAQRLRALGCDIGQGYLYAQPMPAEQLKLWLVGRLVVPVIATPVNFDVDEVTDTVTLVAY